MSGRLLCSESRDAYQIQSPSHGWPSYHPPHHQEHHNHHHSHTPAGWGWDDKHQHQHDFRSYFDIALTALAFLSFGIFLLNLLLNALLFAGLLTTTGGTGGTVTYTTTGTGTGTGTGTATGTNGGGMTVTYTTTGGTTIPGGTTVTTTGTGTGIGIGRASARAGTGDIYYNTTAVKDDEARIRRRKRATLELYLDPMSSMDLIALNVLKSIDAMTEKHECAGKVFCESNRQAQIIRKGFQFLMPLCSVSASFIRKKLGWQEDIWDHLTAVLLGVGEANCQAHFPHC
ncbi:unnamed protein product [Allacma fusca]|uniref:Uncharacterized protein n=1 Tax=Allacma fusca TaxID=39272 RepID=A0A8J2J7D8_9HEXA|nr:unnamed protein product [Allacma fusca]